MSVPTSHRPAWADPAATGEWVREDIPGQRAPSRAATGEITGEWPTGMWERRAVQAHVIIAESEQAIWEVLQRKLEAHEQMKSAMKAAVFNRGRESEVKAPYNPTKIDRLPAWLLN